MASLPGNAAPLEISRSLLFNRLSSTAGTAKNMNMGAAGPFKEPANKNIVFHKKIAADRANAAVLAAKTVETALNMHKPVFTACKRGEGKGLN